MIIGYINRKNVNKNKFLTKDTNALSYFSNNTLCIKREVLKDIGEYNEINYAEDVELCMRIHQSKWNMFHNKNMILKHKPRPTVKETLRQWANYGQGTVNVQFIHMPKNELDILSFDTCDKNIYQEKELAQLLFYSEKAPFPIVIFLSDYLFMMMAFFVALISAVLDFESISLLSALIGIVFLYKYAKVDFKRKKGFSFIDSLKLFVMRFMVNSMYLVEGLITSIRKGGLYINAYIWDRQQD